MNYLTNILFYVDEDKTDSLNGIVKNILGVFSSNIAGGIILLILLIVLVFSFISNSSRK